MNCKSCNYIVGHASGCASRHIRRLWVVETRTKGRVTWGPWLPLEGWAYTTREEARKTVIENAGMGDEYQCRVVEYFPAAIRATA